jgi:hypothetical protein
MIIRNGIVVAGIRDYDTLEVVTVGIITRNEVVIAETCE